MKSKQTLIKMTFTAVLAAMICVVTAAVSIPLPGGGYANPGDCLVLLSGILLGGPWGALAAGIGSALADILLGYVIYAPATLIIKALTSSVAYILYKTLTKTPVPKIISMLIAAIAAEAIMVAGYFTYEAVIYGISGAIPGVPGNSTQGVVCTILALILYSLLVPTGVSKKILKLTSGK